MCDVEGSLEKALSNKGLGNMCAWCCAQAEELWAIESWTTAYTASQIVHTSYRTSSAFDCWWVFVSVSFFVCLCSRARSLSEMSPNFDQQYHTVSSIKYHRVSEPCIISGGNTDDPYVEKGNRRALTQEYRRYASHPSATVEFAGSPSLYYR
jgi:hypothetical protein